MSEEIGTNSSNSIRNLSLDVGLGVALLFVLVAVYSLDRNVGADTPLPEDSGPVVKTIEEEEPAQSQEKPLRLAVTKPFYDDMGHLLKSLGSGFQYSTIEMDALLDPTTFEAFDIIFLTCSPIPRDWAESISGEAARQGTVKAIVKQENIDRVHDNLRRFVERGGTIYASDWIFGVVEWAFPELVDQTKREPGKEQTVTAEAADPGLQNILGSQIPLKFDKPGWYPAAFMGPSVNVLLRGRYETMTGKQVDAPLLVKFSLNEGTVVFSSFHNEQQNSELELKVLRYLVFATVLAKTEAKVTKTLVEGGFSPAARSLLSATKESPSVTQIHHCEKAGPLSFVLGFENRGAVLQLTVISPSGESIEKVGSSSIRIDVPEAAVGDWKYTIKAVKIPHENFPYTLTIGKK